MAVNTKAIKRRLRSVKNTKKITKAMELVAAAKMRQAVEAALATRSYALEARDLLARLSQTEQMQLALMEKRLVKNVLVILITSNRGLCGSFNANIIRKTMEYMKRSVTQEKTVQMIAVGKKGAEVSRRANYELVAYVDNLPDTPTYEDITGVTRVAIDGYKEKKYDQVLVAYTGYQSALRQHAHVRQILPLAKHDIDDMLEEGSDMLVKAEARTEIADSFGSYMFEPSPLTVLEMLTPRLVEMQMYQAFLESAASEHSARMMAMRNASDSATDMIFELNLHYNKARQAGITQEIAEIAGGAAALG